MQILPSLLAGLKVDARKGRGGNIEISDFGVSAFSMFFMQSASFLAFQRGLEKRGSLQRPDPVRDRQNSLRQLYTRQAGRGGSRAFAAVFRTHGDAADRPLRQAFGRLGGRTLIAWDGTQYFSSQKLGCPNCLTRERSNGHDRELSLPAVCDGRGARPLQGLPLMPEFVATQDGAEKQDCERNAVKRWFAKQGARLAPLRPIFLATIYSPVTPSARWSGVHPENETVRLK